MTSVDVTLRGAGQRDALRHVRRRRRPTRSPALIADARLAARRARQHDGRRARQHADAGPASTTRAEQFRADANVLDGVELIGGGTVADMLWARPAVTVLGIDVPPVVGSAVGGAGVGRARGSACASRRAWTGRTAQDALVAHLRGAGAVEAAAARSSGWRVGDPFVGSLVRPGVRGAEGRAGGGVRARPMTTEGQGGSIPLCNVFAETYPDAEIFLMGVEEPRCLIHAPNESVDPTRDRAHGPGRGAVPRATTRRRGAMTPGVHHRRLRRADGARGGAGGGRRAHRRARRRPGPTSSTSPATCRSRSPSGSRCW